MTDMCSAHGSPCTESDNGLSSIFKTMGEKALAIRAAARVGANDTRLSVLRCSALVDETADGVMDPSSEGTVSSITEASERMSGAGSRGGPELMAGRVLPSPALSNTDTVSAV